MTPLQQRWMTLWLSVICVANAVLAVINYQRGSLWWLGSVAVTLAAMGLIYLNVRIVRLENER